MAISPRPDLTDDPLAGFFLAPEAPLQRQYEALRAYFVEGLPSREPAARFGYTPGSFRDLVPSPPSAPAPGAPAGCRAEDSHSLNSAKSVTS